MPYYYFHLVGGDGRHSRDEDGVFFDTVEDAYLDVHRSVLEMSFEMLRHREDPSRHRFEVADQSGLVLFDITFAEILRAHQPSRETLPADFFASVRFEMQRSRVLKADLSRQIAAANATVETTRKLLADPRTVF